MWANRSATAALVLIVAAAVTGGCRENTTERPEAEDTTPRSSDRFAATDDAWRLIGEAQRLHEPQVAWRQGPLPAREALQQLQLAAANRGRGVSMDADLLPMVINPESASTNFWEAACELASLLDAGIERYSPDADTYGIKLSSTGELCACKSFGVGMVGIVPRPKVQQPGVSGTGELGKQMLGAEAAASVEREGDHLLLICYDPRVVTFPGALAVRWLKDGKPLTQWQERPEWDVASGFELLPLAVPTGADEVELSLPLELSLETSTFRLAPVEGSRQRQGEVIMEIEQVTSSPEGIEIRYRGTWPRELSKVDGKRYQELKSAVEASDDSELRQYRLNSLFQFICESGLPRYRVLAADAFSKDRDEPLHSPYKWASSGEKVAGMMRISGDKKPLDKVSVTIARTRSVRANVRLRLADPSDNAQ
jgi:hypothetical protein